MSNISAIVAEGDEYPRVAIYLIHPHQLHGLLTGKVKATNLPEGFKIYKVVCWQQDQCDGSIAVWATHPSFDEASWGSLVETKYIRWKDVIEKTE